MSYQVAVRRLRAELGDLLERRDTVQDLTAYRSYENDPIGFIRDVLKAELWSKQVKIVESIIRRDRVIVVGANATGKDFTIAQLALWWAYCRDGLVLVTSPTQRQVREVLFGEIAKAWHRAQDLPGELFAQALRLGPDANGGVLGFTSSAVSNLTGFHGPRILGVLSEAQGLEPMAWEAMLACATGSDDKLLAVGNPLAPVGRFFESARSDAWASITIPATEHPNVIEGRTVIPGGPSPAWIQRIASEYGSGSNTYGSRVLSIFPDSGEESLFRRSWLDAAAERWADPDHRTAARPVVLGVNPARYGPDATAVAIRRGSRLERVETWRGLDTHETAMKVIELAPEGSRIVVDTIGVGSGVHDAIRATGWTNLGEFNAGSRAGAPEKFLNLRAASYWHLRTLLENGEIELPPDERLFDELLATNWSPTADGKVQAESKDVLKRRLGRSPDRADSVCIAFSRMGVEPAPFFGVGDRVFDLRTMTVHGLESEGD